MAARGTLLLSFVARGIFGAAVPWAFQDEAKPASTVTPE
jgi:hypothetical protein